jgi:pSer/pThr/pTyr-binding forkhead associated (FHA) protein
MNSIARLVWEDPVTHEQREYLLSANSVVVIGRIETADICIAERHMSRHHAVVRCRDGVFTVADLGSAAGFFVNDRRVVGETALAHGDMIRFYVPTIRFEEFGNR